MQDYVVAREGCALIRVNSDRVLRVTGMDCFEALDAVFSMDIEMLLPNRGVTGLFLDEGGAVIALATVFKGDEDLILFTQGETSEALTAHLTSSFADQDAAIEDMSATYDILCLVGPHAEKAMETNLSEDILGLSYLTFEENPDIGQLVFRMGYSGEYEYRILVPTGDTGIADRLSQPGDGFEVTEIKEEIQALLMLEMRSLNFAQLNSKRDPLAAGLHWMIDFRKPEFPGQAALQARLDDLQETGLMLRFDAQANVEQGDVLAIEGQPVGRVVTAAFSPTLDAFVVFAYVQHDLSWVGVRFELANKDTELVGQGVSAPLFVTRTVLAA
ncbi:aminomethyl transferase family protein [Leisingera sp. ANG-M1]|uniref:aminomethyl transferase family protein n=1 Tax=Leisingera sp. ANG-M1 TaxID=1577895 RepID=UPI00187CB336|nr:aminomethyl transferase family protein [Leisingera sp. ANG-M1]